MVHECQRQADSDSSFEGNESMGEEDRKNCEGFRKSEDMKYWISTLFGRMREVEQEQEERMRRERERTEGHQRFDKVMEVYFTYTTVRHEGSAAFEGGN